MTRGQRRFIGFYNAAMPGLVMACLIIAIGAVIGTYINYQNQAQEQEKRSTAIRGILDCFDTYAKQSSATSKAVRDASVDVSEATTDRDVALDAVFKYVATNPAETNPEGARLFTVLLGTNAALVESQAHLAVVRIENPVPDPPSTFCEVKP